MLHQRPKKKIKNIAILFVILSISILSSTGFAHGPKGHSAGTFTSFEAVKQGVKLYDKLLAAGKLDESWEIGLSNIIVLMREREGKKELVVKFTRSQGDPSSVYIFFSNEGQYSGSNFTGK